MLFILTTTPWGCIMTLVIIMIKGCEHCTRTKHRTEEEKKYLKNRLKTIEGQIRGISQMIDDDRYCDEVLIQISAVNKSLKGIGNKMLKGHLSTCVVEDIQNNKLEVIDDVMDLIGRLN